MKVFNIKTAGSYSQKHCVVAENMAEAERIFLAAYSSTIESIELHSNYVQIQKWDEQAKS